MQLKKNLFLCAVTVIFASAGCRPNVSRTEWPVMGTIAALQTRTSSASDANMRARVQEIFEKIEYLLNAHDKNSELSRLAPLDEEEIQRRCSPVVRPCYETAFRLAKESGGAFNPRWRGEKTLDLGAIAKGFAVDLAADALSGSQQAILVDLGGNIKAVSTSKSSAGSWQSGVRAIDGSGIAARLTLEPGEALATSAKYFRGNHIYDPRSGHPVENGVASVTVLCPSAMLADALSTTLFVMRPEEGLKFLKEKQYQASVLFIMDDGRCISNDGRFLY